MKGRSKKPPMDVEEMMDLAKALLYRKGWINNVMRSRNSCALV